MEGPLILSEPGKLFNSLPSVAIYESDWSAKFGTDAGKVGMSWKLEIIERNYQFQGPFPNKSKSNT